MLYVIATGWMADLLTLLVHGSDAVFCVRLNYMSRHQYTERMPDQRKSGRFADGSPIPVVTQQQWKQIMEEERTQILPTSSWDQFQVLHCMYHMLKTIRLHDTSTSKAKAFHLLPQGRTGRVFLKLTKRGLLGLCRRVPDHKKDKAFKKLTEDNIISIFKEERIIRLLRLRLPNPLKLAGEFCRTDGVQLQIVCGTQQLHDRNHDGDGDGDAEIDDDDDGRDYGDGTKSLSKPVNSNGQGPRLFAVDPGYTFLYTTVRVESAPAPDVNAPHNVSRQAVKAPDGLDLSPATGYIKFVPDIHLSKGEYDRRMDFGRRRKPRKCFLDKTEYKSALKLSAASTLKRVIDEDAGVTFDVLIQIAAQYLRAYRTLHDFESSPKIARLRFDAYIAKQRTYDYIAAKFKAMMGDDGICAWGSARWNHAMKGRTPCAAAAIYRHLR